MALGEALLYIAVVSAATYLSVRVEDWIDYYKEKEQKLAHASSDDGLELPESESQSEREESVLPFEEAMSETDNETLKYASVFTAPVNFSDYDMQMAEQIRSAVLNRIKGKSAKDIFMMRASERVAMVEQLGKDLLALCGLDDVSCKAVAMPLMDNGRYCDEDKALYINVSKLIWDYEYHSDEDIDYFIHHAFHEMCKAIVHEMRHAIQHRAIWHLDEDYFGTDFEQRLLWAYNASIYIDYEDDPVKYMNQIVERDARAFSELVIGGGVLSGE